MPPTTLPPDAQDQIEEAIREAIDLLEQFGELFAEFIENLRDMF